MSKAPIGVSIILVRDDGKVILQQRDDKPGILYPGQLGFFGGHNESGEEPIDTALRELAEETNIPVHVEDLHYFQLYQRNKAEHGVDKHVHVYVLRRVNTSGLEVYEGTGFQVVSSEDYESYDLAPPVRDILKEYFEQKHANSRN